MMRASFLLASFASVLLVSCRDTKVAELYAARMGEVLKSYRNRVEDKIQAEQQSYIDLAKVYDASEATRIQDQLDTSRNRQTREFSDRIQKATQGKPVNQKCVWASDINAALQNY